MSYAKVEEPELKQLKTHIYITLGFKANRYEIKHLKRRINTRMLARRSPDYRSYLDLLRTDIQERQKLKEALTVNVTEFFRNPEVYQTLREKILSPLIERKTRDNAPLKVWSLGCSTGEEPYSLAMILADAYGGELPEGQVIIHATDIDPEALKTAAQGVYTDTSKIPGPYRDIYMNSLQNGQYAIKKALRKAITFTRHDVFTEPPLKDMDLLFCRNTIIYFTKESKKYLYSLFNNSLAMGGYLVLGKSEAFIAQKDYGFEIAERKSHIFKKIETPKTRGRTR